MMEMVIWSNEHGAYWRPDERGYTRKLSEAGRYPLARAIQICVRANAHLDDEAVPYETIRPISEGDSVDA